MERRDQMVAELRAFYAWLPSAGPIGRLERDGVVATVTRAVPDRSLMNAVVYDRPERLAAALPELARAYDDAGVRAWTVWVPDDDRDVAALLERSGHALDAAPAAMELDLAAFPPADPGDLDWSRGPFAALTALNDAAYGLADAPFSKALREAPGMHVYVARVDGEPACALAILDAGGAALVELVATAAPARGRGLATRLLGVALAEARERGCTTSSLQATKLGAPVYERLGYRTLGRFEMWERRRAA